MIYYIYNCLFDLNYIKIIYLLLAIALRLVSKDIDKVEELSKINVLLFILIHK